MAIETINIGTSPNDGTGDPLRVAFNKTNDNFLTITTDGGAEITVNNPVTLTPTDLDTALADLAGAGGAVDSVNYQTGVVSIDLQSVADENNELTTDINVKSTSFKIGDLDEDNSGVVVVIDNDGGGVSFQKQLVNIWDFFKGSFGGINNLGNSFGFSFDELTSNVSINQNDRQNGVYSFAIDEIDKTANFTADNYTRYTANGTLTVTDPTPIANKGFIVHVIGGSVTIGGVAYTSGALVYRYYDGSVWVSTNMNSSTSQDLQSVLNEGDTAEDSIIELTSSTTTDKVELNNNYLYVGDDAEFIQIEKNKITHEETFRTELVFTEATANRVITFKDESGTVALTSDIPSPITIDATPTDGSSNAVSSNGVFDALALKQDELYDWQTQKGLYYYNDFEGQLPSAGFTVDGRLNRSQNGTSTVSYLTPPNSNWKNVGTPLLGVSITSSSGGNYLHSTPEMGFLLGNGEYKFETLIQFQNLMEGLNTTNQLMAGYGLSDKSTISTANPTLSGCLFVLETGNFTNGTQNSLNWQCVTSSGGVKTSTLTSVTYNNTAWVKLSLIINASATEVKYFIDDILVATHTTNIPTSRLGFIVGINNRVGTTIIKGHYVDYIKSLYTFTTDRY